MVLLQNISNDKYKLSHESYDSCVDRQAELSCSLCAGVMGAVIAPLTLLGGPLMVRAAWYTAGIVGGLSTVAMCAPSEKFLSMGGPLAVGFGVVFASSLGEMHLQSAADCVSV